jgi:hypothetical protein
LAINEEKALFNLGTLNPHFSAPDPSLKITIIAYITMANVEANKFTHKTKQLKKIEFLS